MLKRSLFQKIVLAIEFIVDSMVALSRDSPENSPKNYKKTLEITVSLHLD